MGISVDKILGGFTALLVMAGCSDSGERSDGPAGGADPVVVDAVAPYDAESQLNADLLHYRIERRQNSALEDCLESRGVPRLGLEFEQLPPDQLLGTILPDFPDLDALESDGFRPLSEDDFFTDDDRNILSQEQQDAMIECEESDPSLQAASDTMNLYNDISGRWFVVMDEIDSLDELGDLRHQFSECVLDEGIAPEYSENEVVFIDVLMDEPAQVATIEAANEIRRELGQIYARCGRDLFERKFELRSGERRDTFLEEHSDDIVALSDELYGDGILDELDEVDRGDQ